MADEKGDPLVKIADEGGKDAFLVGNRAALLTVLARQLASDRSAGEKTRSDEGWCSSEACITGVWGRAAKKTRNHLNVLVHRLRGQLTDAGIDPYCVEKRRGGIRLRAKTIDSQTGGRS